MATQTAVKADNGTTAAKTEQTKEIAKHEPTMSERFTLAVVKEFGSISNEINLTPYQKRLAQHLFLKIDATLKELEVKRLAKNQAGGVPIEWANINMQKLATDAMHRVDLGLDALIPNHIHPIPYLNGRTKKYDLDLRIGFEGKEYYRRKMAVVPPADIIKELVYSKDKFKPVKRTPRTPVETYEFEIAETPFDRGEVVGGFAYIVYDDEKKNQLVLVTDKDFKKSEKAAMGDTFWKNHPDEMKYKTLVTRAVGKLPIDPEKVSAAFLAVEKEDDYIDAEVVRTEVASFANTGKTLSIENATTTEEAERTGIDSEAETLISCPNGGVQVAISHCNAACSDREGCPQFDTEEKRKPDF